jgi:AbiV family abortive infection protein
VKEKKLNQYKGRLTSSQIAQGINASRLNGKRLSRDAVALLERGSFPSAASLAALAIEEAGKASILRELAVARNEQDVKEAWRDYRSHTRKNVMWIFLELVANGARRLDDFRPIFDPDSDHPELLDQIKQLGFYTDCLGNAHWSVPEQVIDEKLAKMLVNAARALLASERQVTLEEIDLWVKHVGPVWKGHSSWMKQALVNWQGEMQACGLAPSGKNAMSEFIHRGVGNPTHPEPPP